MINKLIKNNISKSTIIIAFLVLATSIFLGSVNIIIISLSLYILFNIFYPLINQKVFDSKILISVIIFFSYIILLQCIVLISWLLSRNFPLNYTPLLLLPILLIMYFYNYFINRQSLKNNQTKVNGKTWNTQDVLSLLTAILILAIIIIPPLTLKPEYIKSTAVMSLISGNVDDSSHLSLVNDNLQFDRGILFRSDAEGKTRNGGFYPAGWHSISAVLIKTFCPTIKTGSASLIAYAIQKIFWFFILIYLLTRISFIVLKYLKSGPIDISSYIWVPLSALFFNYVLLLPIFKEGFYSFLPQLIATLLTIPIIIQLIQEKGSPSKFRLIPLLFIVSIGGCLSWFLPLPAFLLTSIIIIAGLIFNKKINIIIKNIYNIIKANIILLIILSLAMATQIFAMTSNHNESSVSFLAGILMGGGITTYNEFFYILIFVGFMASLIIAGTKARKNVYLLLSLIASLSLFCTFIYIIQIINMGKNEYYYYKTLDILTLATIPFCISGFGLIIRKIAASGKNIIITTICISVIIFAIFLQLVGLDSSTLSFARGYRAFSSPIDNSIMEQLDNHISQTNYFNKSYSFYYVPDVNFYFQNEVAVMMSKSNTPDSDCFTSIRRSIWKSPPINQLLNNIVEKCSGYNINIVTNKANIELFERTIIDMGVGNSIKAKSY